ncbi:MAG: hypothetical protein CVV24_05595 [Ignavibacteriae bacterium HGW-Ignavibacteriae-3]|nr:MAG: hypothetical protein CVV24_05595 [Ignavibacteriae bacterium HGW-Ignavibacteriae-3]
MKKVIVALLVLLVASCDLLTTRNPEQPVTLANANIPATTPDILFDNLKSALEEKVVENYMVCFVDTAFSKKKYRFIPSSGSSSQFPVLNSWNLESERQYFKNQKTVSKAGKSIAFGLSNKLNTQFGDSAIYQFDYNLSIAANDLSISGEYIGTIQFKIALDSRNQWVITEIDDYKKSSFPSWSELKGRLY